MKTDKAMNKNDKIENQQYRKHNTIGKINN